MTDDRKEALEELEKELLDEDLLSDMPESLVNSDTWNWDEEKDLPESTFSFDDTAENAPAEENPEEDFQIINQEAEVHPMRKNTRKATSQRQEDKWQIILMAIASFLCLGIIGVMIYWLETFFR